MAELSKKLDVSQLSHEELVKEVLRLQRKCDKFKQDPSKRSSAYDKLEMSFEMLKRLYNRQQKSIGINHQTNTHLIDLCEMAIEGLGVKSIIRGLRSVNDARTLCQMHRSEN